MTCPMCEDSRHMASQCLRLMTRKALAARIAGTTAVAGAGMQASHSTTGLPATSKSDQTLPTSGRDAQASARE